MRFRSITRGPHWIISRCQLEFQRVYDLDSYGKQLISPHVFFVSYWKDLIYYSPENLSQVNNIGLLCICNLL